MTRLLPLTAIAFLAACVSADAAPSEADAELAMATIDQSLPSVVVYKTETCGCCNGWVEHMRAAGFQVDARNVRDIMSVKVEAGVPGPMVTCHTAMIDGYVVEGHVPAQYIKQMLAEHPDIAGIGVPGMPQGSPGMEGPSPQPYQVLAFDHDGNVSVYAEVDPR